MNVLVLNCGSSSVKFQLIATDLELINQDADKRLAHGLIERLGGAGIVTFTAEGQAPQTIRRTNQGYARGRGDDTALGNCRGVRSRWSRQYR